MSAVTKALWLIENRYLGTLTLDDIAEHVGVSRSHISRMFPVVTGISISAYLRGRRLTEAAKALAAGAPDILSVALEAGYNSHEAFTRAFREQFGLTPEQVRAKKTTDGLKLVEPLRIDDEEFTDVGEPQIIDSRPLLIAGLAERHAFSKPEGIPSQWARFIPYLGSIPDVTDEIATYGVSSDMMHGGDSFLMLTGVPVRDLTNLQPELTAIRLPAQRYAVFTHRGHISAMRTTVHSIYNRWLPDSGLQLSGNPDLIEHYGREFDPPTGTGEVGVWIPIRA